MSVAEPTQAPQLVLINRTELDNLKEAKALLERRLVAEQEQDPVKRLKQLAIVKLDTLQWNQGKAT